MLLDYLLLTPNCLLTGKTSGHENQAGFSLQPELSETILVFKTDSPEFRSVFKARDEKLCDRAIFYAKQDIRIICLCELKDTSRIVDAKDQLLNTYRLISNAQPKSRDCLKIIFKAFVVMGDSTPTPRNIQGHQQTLERQFGNGNVRISRHRREIGDCIRGRSKELASNRKQRRKKRRKNKK